MIQTKGFQLTIEAERQRQLFEGIKECCEIRRTIIGSSARTSVSMPRSDSSDVLNVCDVVCQVVLHTATHRSVIRNSSYEIFM
jgi:uncharacterized protein (DUF1015 family)